VLTVPVAVKITEAGTTTRTFHIEIGKASGNAALTLLIGTLWDYRRMPMFAKI